MRTLTTALCTLEPQVAGHAAELFEVLCDPAIYEFEGQPPPSLERLTAGLQRKESRRSPDGSEHWLNWVVRRPGGELAGYVQATVLPDGQALVGYEFASRHWRQGLGSSAVAAMLAEVTATCGVHRFVALLKRANGRSRGLLHKLGFVPMPAELAAAHAAPPDEDVLHRPAWPARPGHEPPTLHTERLILRPPDAVAARLYQRFYTDASASRAYGGPLTPGAAWARLLADRGSWPVQGLGVWVLQRRPPGDAPGDPGDGLIGTCGFWQGPGWPRELTWWLLPEARGTGLAAEASRAVIEQALHAWHWPAVDTCMNDDNAPARALALRLGMAPVARVTCPDGLARDLHRRWAR
jgi:[ribosomal protein S5]-alanine N-acetyltransferase